MRMAADHDLFAGVDKICDAAKQQANVDGVALAVLTRSARVRELIYATIPSPSNSTSCNTRSAKAPASTPTSTMTPKSYPELTDVAQTSRWPTFASEATRLGAQALFAFPVPDGVRPMGVLELYRRTAGGLADPEHSSASSCATAIAHQLGANWSDHVSRFQTPQEAIDATAIASASHQEPVDPFTRTQVHVAGGMVAVQLGVRAEEGVDRLRAFAYACGRPVSAVAADIIARRLTLRDQQG